MPGKPVRLPLPWPPLRGSWRVPGKPARRRLPQPGRPPLPSDGRGRIVRGRGLPARRRAPCLPPHPPIPLGRSLPRVARRARARARRHSRDRDRVRFYVGALRAACWGFHCCVYFGDELFGCWRRAGAVCLDCRQRAASVSAPCPRGRHAESCSGARRWWSTAASSTSTGGPSHTQCRTARAWDGAKRKGLEGVLALKPCAAETARRHPVQAVAHEVGVARFRGFAAGRRAKQRTRGATPWQGRSGRSRPRSPNVTSQSGATFPGGDGGGLCEVQLAGPAADASPTSRYPRPRPSPVPGKPMRQTVRGSAAGNHLGTCGGRR